MCFDGRRACLQHRRRHLATLAAGVFSCGTAGFLISSVTHILRAHTKPADLKRGLVDGALLKPAQWKFLEEQAFTGYDNDANMVKIAI